MKREAERDGEETEERSSLVPHTTHTMLLYQQTGVS